MRLFILALLTLALYNRASSQTFILKSDELNLINHVTPNTDNKAIYFVFLDKNDCFNCTLSTTLIAEHIDSSQVFVLAHEIPKHLREDFIDTYGLSTSFNYVYNEELLRLFKNKSNTLFQEKSFIAEVNATYTTILPLKKFKDKHSFGEEIKIVKEKEIYNVGHYISAIPKFISFSDNFIAFTSPKNSIYYFSKDTLHTGINLDSSLLQKAFEYVIKQQPDSVLAYNTFSKCMETYNSQLKKLGLTIITPQNFTICNNHLYVLLQVSFPIWTTQTDVTFTGELFLLKLALDGSENWKHEDITPIDNSDLPNGKSIFAYNYFSYDPEVNLMSVGFFLDSNLVKDVSSNHNHCTYKLIDGVYVRLPKCSSHHPFESVKEYSNLQNIALIHYKLNDTTFHYTYLPIILKNNSKYLLPISYTKQVLYHSYASKMTNDGFIDLCTINGQPYVINYGFIDQNYIVKDITRVRITGRLQSAISSNNGFEYIVEIDGIFYRKELLLK